MTQAARYQSGFFTKDPTFKKHLFTMMLTITLQNVIAYSVNMADNIMLGSFSQNALSGAATVNQIFFMIQQLSLGIGDIVVMIGSQYWGKQDLSPIRRLTGIALKMTAVCCIIVFCVCTFIPELVLGFFTSEKAILSEGLSYIRVVKYSFVLFMFSFCLMAALRAVEVVKIAFIISVISLVVNVGINGVLIFGLFGFPRMGIVGAAIGTVTARGVEFAVILFYVLKKDKVLRLFSENPFRKDKGLSADFRKAAVMVIPAEIFWAVATPFQTAILGSLSADAIAANSIATTFYNFLKVVARAAASASAVMIGRAIGEGDIEEVKAKGRTLCVLFLVIGIVLGLGLFLLRGPLLSMYTLTDEALLLADQMIILYSFVMVAMSYMMPTISGIIKAGGDTKFVLLTNLTGIWCVALPLAFLAAYVWHAPVVIVVLCAQSDQFLKCIPTFLRFRKYTWIHKLTR